MKCDLKQTTNNKKDKDTFIQIILVYVFFQQHYSGQVVRSVEPRKARDDRQTDIAAP
jgi:hypothetical protein